MNQEKTLLTLQGLLSESGFIDSSQLLSRFTPPPEGGLVMHNQYSLITCCTISNSEHDIVKALHSKKEEMHSFVRKVLLELESQKGLIVDGYLLIIISEMPDKDAREAIQELEQDTKVCRKHVLWPSFDGEHLERTQYVTVLSLPIPLDDASELTSSFSISEDANKLLVEYEKQGSLDRLMDSIKNGVLRNAD